MGIFNYIRYIIVYHYKILLLTLKILVRYINILIMYKKLKMKMKNFEILKIFHFFQYDIKCSIDIQRHEK